MAFQEVRAGEGGVDGGTRIVGQAVSPDRVRRGLLQDCQGRLGTQVAAHLALIHQQLQPLHRQRARTEDRQAGAATKDCPRPGSMLLQQRLHRLLIAVPIWVHCPAHGTQVLPEH